MTDSAAGRGVFPELRRSLPSQLPAYLAGQRWFGGKARTIRSAELIDVIPILLAGDRAPAAFLLIVSISYATGPGDSYAIPVIRVELDSAATLGQSHLKIAASEAVGGSALVDALKNEAFLSAMLQLIHRQATLPGEKGELRASQTTAYARFGSAVDGNLRPKPAGAEQSNTSIIYGDQLILKFFRRVEEGINPDLEIGFFLTEKAHFPHTPAVVGSLQYHTREGKDSAQGILQAFVPNQGDAWRYTMGSLAEVYVAVTKESDGLRGGESTPTERATTDFVREAAGPYLESAALLAQRTAQMHLGLASDARDREFAPEAFTMEFQRSLEQSMLALADRVLGQLREKLSSLPAEWRAAAQNVAGNEKEIARRFQAALSQPIRAMRTRIHGDYHLGQVLYTGSDFVIIDFEGEPARPLAERRIKRSPLQDVAGMLRSFHYAAFAPLLTAEEGQATSAQNLERLGVWAASWNVLVAERFLTSYLAAAGPAAYLPQTREETKVLLELHLLEKAVYELGYELNNRPSWVGIPLQGISRILAA
jgi:trehalose synthase-fused probable maltokinase